MDALKPRMRRRSLPRRQEGFLLVMTLVILVIITLSSMALMMASKAGVSAAGNIAFRQAAVRMADSAVENGFNWIATQLAANPNALDFTSATSGYYSKIDEVDTSNCVPSGVTTFAPGSYDFANTACAKTLASPVGGYTLYYVVHRMANTANTACPSAGCMSPGSTTLAGVVSQVSHGDSMESVSGANDPTAAAVATSTQTVYYRITVKVAGPKRNNRYIQAFVY